MSQLEVSKYDSELYTSLLHQQNIDIHDPQMMDSSLNSMKKIIINIYSDFPFILLYLNNVSMWQR